MVSFDDLNLELDDRRGAVKIGDTTVTVRLYLPIAEKTELIQFVVNGALDDNTGCFSPLRVEVCFGIAMCKWYSDIEFTDEMLVDIGEIYDLLDSNGVISQVINCIPPEERKFMEELVNDTMADIARYNNSAAGIIQSMNFNAEGLNNQLQEVIKKVEHKEGLELLASIKDMVGND